MKTKIPNEKVIEAFEKEITDINAQLDDLTMRKAKLLWNIKQLDKSNMEKLLSLVPKEGGIA